MALDLFNNISNDYIRPTLAPCPGSSDSGTEFFEFLPGQQVGIISGSAIFASMFLGDISQPVEGWTQQTKILQPGEITYIAGLTKGISSRSQNFLLIDTSTLISVDLSINYYQNFRYVSDHIFATADYANGISINTALDMAFDAKNIKIGTGYDPSILSFSSTQEGYYFNISNINASTWDNQNPSIGTNYYAKTLINDISTNLSAYRYSNGAMLGYVLKVTYPTISGDADRFVEINRVPDFVNVWTPNSSLYELHRKAVDVGLNAQFNCDPSTVMSAGDYLDYVQTNNLWEKVGVVQIWLTSVDAPNSLINNLINGFYVFNPHDAFPVKIDYMTIL